MTGESDNENLLLPHKLLEEKTLERVEMDIILKRCRLN